MTLYFRYIAVFSFCVVTEPQGCFAKGIPIRSLVGGLTDFFKVAYKSNNMGLLYIHMSNRQN